MRTFNHEGVGSDGSTLVHGQLYRARFIGAPDEQEPFEENFRDYKAVQTRGLFAMWRHEAGWFHLPQFFEFEDVPVTCWISFHDLHSGGSRKTSYNKIFIEAVSREAALEIFQERFGRDPENYTCMCCGPDFSITEEGDEYPSLEEATEYHRGRTWSSELGGYRPATISVEEYLATEKVLAIPLEPVILPTVTDDRTLGEEPAFGLN